MKTYSQLTGSGVILAAVFIAGCATKQYPIEAQVAPAEAAMYTCHDIALELVKADQVEQQINATGSTDVKSVMGFLGDFGIGNSMAKSHARDALATRRAELHDAQLQKGCMNDIVPTAAVAPTAAALAPGIQGASMPAPAAGAPPTHN
jgi:hypothetical protein